MNNLKEIIEDTKDFSILYVEDDEDAKVQIMDILNLLFKNIYSAKNGQEGLEIFRNRHSEIDLILTDVQMPIMDGLEMSKKIKEINPNKHIVVLSAHNDSSYFIKAIDLGVDCFVIKPISADKFLQSIAKTTKHIKNQKIQEFYHSEMEKELYMKSEQLERNLIIDELTGLFNKAKLNIELSKDGNYTVLLANVDNFDNINSTYGYDVGDDMLRQVATFFSSLAIHQCKLFRLASDEFVFLFENIDIHRATVFAEDVISGLSSRRFSFEDIELNLTSTIGIAKGSGKQTLVEAHIAMKEVREIGKNRYYFYTGESELITKQKNNIEWMRKVRSALENDTVIPYFQPIVNNQTLKIEKYECLARIIEVNRIVTPNYFIEPARLVGMLPNITKVMLKKCFEFFSDKDFEFSINISECDLKDGYLIKTLDELLGKYNISPNRVVLEILENISAQGSSEALSQLKDIKNIGIKLAMDDFGSEKSNFYRLQELNVDYVKIDGMFIKNICTNHNSYQITKTIKHLASGLNAKVIAEFVHDKDVYEKVKELGIEYSQGYFFGKPKESL